MNLSLPTRNFGWPIVSYGCNYGDPLGTAVALAAAYTTRRTRRRWRSGTRPRPRPAARCSTPAITFPEWKGNFFVGGLAGKTLYRFVLNSRNAIVGQEPFFAGRTRSAT